jgi:hypothetical protein
MFDREQALFSLQAWKMPFSDIAKIRNFPELLLSQNKFLRKQQLFKAAAFALVLDIFLRKPCENKSFCLNFFAKQIISGRSWRKLQNLMSSKYVHKMILFLHVADNFFFCKKI